VVLNSSYSSVDSSWRLLNVKENSLTECADVFSDKRGKTTLGVHHIELMPNTQPIRSAPYRLYPEKREYLRKELYDLL